MNFCFCPASLIAAARARFLPFVLSIVLALASLTASARYLDDVEVEADAGGKTVLIRVRFNIGVQYLRHVPEKQGEDLQIFLRQTSGDVPPPIAEEVKAVAATDQTPRFIVSYPLQIGAPTKRLQVKFDKLVQFRVRQGIDPHSIEILLQALPATVAKPSKPSKPAAPGRYAIALDTHGSAEQASAAALPRELSRYQIFLSKSEIADVPLYDRNIGYFDTRDDAEVIRDRLLSKFPDARVIDMSAGTAPAVAEPRPTPVPTPDSKTEPKIAVTPSPSLPKAVPSVPVPAPVPGAPAAAGVSPPPVSKPSEPAAPAVPAVAATATPEVERQAREAMQKARSAFAAAKWDEAIDPLNQLLILPPNSQSQQAQEMVGIARDRSGQLGKAKAEYELYLKLYADAEGASRVKERLALLEKRLAEMPAGAKPPSEPLEAQAPVKSVFGSFAQYYYDGKTKSETAFNTPTTVDQASLSSRDLSSIVTTVDANARYRSQQSDLRFVFRDTDTVSLIDKNPSRNRLDAAYVDYRGLQNPYSLRLGRQIGTSGGILGRFDGAIAGYKFAKDWRINVEAGEPVDYGLDSNRYFYGLSLDAENIFDNWSGNVYGIRQMVDGIPDREATGGEIRYFKNGSSLYSTLDYDTLFNKVNIATVQGSIQTKGLTTFTILYDFRKAPPLSTTNAVFGQPVTSISALLKTNTEDQLRQQALAVTADVTQVLASVTTPVTASWQLGADYRLTNVGPLPAYNDIPATPGTGDIHGVTLQAIGSNLYSRRDINVFSTTFLTSPTFHGESVAYSNLTGIGEKWTLEPSLRFYTQSDTTDTKTNRYTAVLRLTYAIRQSISLEGEYDLERSIVDTPLQRDTATNQFFYVGYRVTF